MLFKQFFVARLMMQELFISSRDFVSDLFAKSVERKLQRNISLKIH